MLHCVRRSAKVLWIMEFVLLPNVNLTGCLLSQRVIFLHSLLLAEMLADVFHAVQSLCVQVIPHYYAENISLAHLCELHGWSLRTNPRRVFDAVMFSNEIDLLEIRLQVFLQFFFN